MLPLSETSRWEQRVAIRIVVGENWKGVVEKLTLMLEIARQATAGLVYSSQNGGNIHSR